MAVCAHEQSFAWVPGRDCLHLGAQLAPDEPSSLPPVLSVPIKLLGRHPALKAGRALAAGVAACGAGSLAGNGGCVGLVGTCGGPGQASCPRAWGALTGLLCWGDASSSGAAGATGAPLGGGSRLCVAGGGELDPAERRARDARRGGRLRLEQLSMETPKAVASEAPSHLLLGGGVPWGGACGQEALSPELAEPEQSIPLGGSSGWRPLPMGMGTLPASTPPSHVCPELSSGRWQRTQLIQPPRSPWHQRCHWGDLSCPK